MPSLDKVQKEDIKEVRIEFVENDPDPLLMDVDLSIMTVGWFRTLHAIDNSDIAGMADHFFTAVKKWNFTGRDKKPLPLNAEGLDQLTMATFWDIVAKMSDATAPKEETSTAS